MRIFPSLAVMLLAQASAGYTVAPALAQESVAPATPTPALHYSNKWRLQVSEGANNDGVMRFRVTPRDGTPIDITVHLDDGRGEDGCARDIRDAFKAALDRKTYKIETDDEEDVLVKRRKGPDFAIELVESTVKGTRINFDRE